MEETICTNPQCLKKVKNLEEELQRLRSVGYDMLKQRGHWQAMGKKPTDSSLEFNNLFDHEVEHLAKKLQKSSGMEEDASRLFVSKEFQNMYEYVKNTIFNQVVKTLSKVFLLGTEEEDGEQLYDISRAYGLLLSASGITKEPVHDTAAKQAAMAIQTKYKSLPSTEVELFTTKSAQLSWDLLTTVPPLLSLTPQSSYFKQWHEKELAPTWNKELTAFKLEYYRPILFTSSEGKVTRKGWVGNRQTAATCTDTHDKEKECVDSHENMTAAEEVMCKHCGCFIIPNPSAKPQDYMPHDHRQTWTKYQTKIASNTSTETQLELTPTQSEEGAVVTKYFPQSEVCVKEANLSPRKQTNSKTGSNIGVKLH